MPFTHPANIAILPITKREEVWMLIQLMISIPPTRRQYTGEGEAMSGAAAFSDSLARSLWSPHRDASLAPRLRAAPLALSLSSSTAGVRHRTRSLLIPKRASVAPPSSHAQGAASVSAVSSDGRPKYTRLLPCPSENLPPRVEHLIVSEGGMVLDYICKALDLPPLYVEDLIHFGAVHYALVCPRPPPSATPEQFRIFEEVTAPTVLQKRPSIKGKTVREAQKTFRITRPDEFVETGTYLRVYVHPRRFPRCYEIDWKSRIIAVSESYVVLDKPAGTSVGGTTNNIEERCATFASRALHLDEPLKTTHQIDNCTEGCVVFARTKEFCCIFHKLIRDKEVRKLYLALAAAPVPTGMISHYMRPVKIPPRIVCKDFISGWYLCQLEVVECKEVPLPNSEIMRKLSIEDCGWPFKDVAYECRINLLTGKSHQIRAQLASIGAPLIGDSMYMPAVIAEKTNPHINPLGDLRKMYANATQEEQTRAIGEWVTQHGKEPAVAIGLQASKISWNNEHYEAGTPWWR